MVSSKLTGRQTGAGEREAEGGRSAEMGGSAAVAAVCDGARGCCWCCRHFYVVAWRDFAADVAVAVWHLPSTASERLM